MMQRGHAKTVVRRCKRGLEPGTAARVHAVAASVHLEAFLLAETRVPASSLAGSFDPAGVEVALEGYDAVAPPARARGPPRCRSPPGTSSKPRGGTENRKRIKGEANMAPRTLKGTTSRKKASEFVESAVASVPLMLGDEQC